MVLDLEPGVFVTCGTGGLCDVRFLADSFLSCPVRVRDCPVTGRRVRLAGRSAHEVEGLRLAR